MSEPDFTTLTRRLDKHRPDCWRIHWTDVCVGWVALHATVGGASEWSWRVTMYPGSNPGEGYGGSASTFDEAREKFMPAWLKFANSRTPQDFQDWRDHDRMIAEKYARFDRGDRSPPDFSRIPGAADA